MNKIKALILFSVALLSGCNVNPFFNEAIKTGADIVVDYKKADTFQNLSEIPQDISEAVADTKLEVKKIEQDITNTKLEKIEEQIKSIDSDEAKISLLKEVIKSNEVISVEQEKTKQIRAENNPLVYGSLGLLLGVVISVFCYFLLMLGKRISFK